MSCDFCDRDSLRSRLICETKASFAFPTRLPIVPGHILVCHLRHVATIFELTSTEKDDLWQLAENIQNALKNTAQAQGFNLAWNEGAVAGQTVPHLHLHILPRTPGDQGITEYEPRRFLYRPDHQRAVSPEAELHEIADHIRKNLSTV